MRGKNPKFLQPLNSPKRSRLQIFSQFELAIWRHINNFVAMEGWEYVVILTFIMHQSYVRYVRKHFQFLAGVTQRRMSKSAREELYFFLIVHDNGVD